MIDRIELIRSFVRRKIAALLSTNNDAAARATLANLRRGVGREPGTMPELWDITLEDMPAELMSTDGTPTRGEWAIHTALTLFALHQQGRDLKTHPMSREGSSFGGAVRMLVKSPEDMSRVKRRFNAVLTAGSISEFSYYIRGLILLLKANDISLDYPAFAADLYLFQTETAKNRVLLRWGQDFCRRPDAQPNDNETK